jgi:8-oxo-dGTP diphosphatase
MSEIIHVAAAAIVNNDNEVLISRRAMDTHQGGLWEFPGGKLETGESVEQALHRELDEELGIQPRSYRPLIKITHHYEDKSVLLDVWKVNDFTGEPVANEGQPVKWCSVEALNAEEFPAADVPIIQAINLPEHYMITGKFETTGQFESNFKQAINKGIRLVQLRLTHDWVHAGNRELADEVIDIAASLSSQSGVQLMYNLPDEMSKVVKPDSIHLNSHKLAGLGKRPACDVLSASCHTIEEMKKAEVLGADFIVLSPVQATASHPDTKPLGWHRFSEMVDSINVPVYALGGVSRENTRQAWVSGGQGIAAISALWDAD